MGIFGGGEPSYAGESASLVGMKQQPCKPEYEKMIARVQGQRKTAVALMEALHDYGKVNGGRHSVDFQAKIGGLIVEIQDCDEIVAGLIAQQEADK